MVRSKKAICCLLISLLLLILLLILSTKLLAASLSISPIDPAIEDQQKSVAIWLENYDKAPVYIQVRVMRWFQKNQLDQWEKQTEVVVSPPFTLLKQGQRQMIRLVNNKPAPVGKEMAYRIIIDEIAQDKEQNIPQQNPAVTLGLNLKMRYILPLFVSGKGVWTIPNPQQERDPASATSPQLFYRFTNKQGQQHIEVSNRGIVHARLSAVTLTIDNNKTGHHKIVIADGLLGYVLPGSTMSWPLPQALLPKNIHLSQGGKLEAMVNHYVQPMIIQRE